MKTLVTLALFLFVRDGSCMIAKQIDKETKEAGQDGILNCTIDKDQMVTGQRFSWQRLANDAYPTNVIAIDTDIVTRNPLGDDGRKKYLVTITSLKGSYIYSINIRRLVEGDHGEYRCTVMVSGWATDAYPSTTGELVVQLPPGVDDYGSDTMVHTFEGSSAALHCSAGGVPEPTVTWTRANGNPLPGGQLSFKGNELVIPKVEYDDAGIYRCTAENGVRPPEWRDIPLVIFHSPRMDAFRKTIGQAVDKNYDVELACIVSGDPEPELMWYKQDKRITDDHKHEVHKIFGLPGQGLRYASVWFTLRIHNIQAGDYGNYTCKAQNIYGNDSANITLYYTPTCQGYACMRYDLVAAAQSIRMSVLLICLTFCGHYLGLS
ncbi:opioid-binding protein/cell adhesion molecule homolog [Lineus longissimus]|uniref:opioid-binding protein/cell adhesion molecule homolog n=1 Tax=Lineus longissimus TaxID=88925 RepID=UPI002B4CC7D5